MINREAIVPREPDKMARIAGMFLAARNLCCQGATYRSWWALFQQTARAHHLRELSGYFLVSLIALVVDMGVLLLLAQAVHYLFAVVVGFLCGALTHYFLSVFFVFRKRKLLERKFAELAVFLGIGLLALLINVLGVFLAVEIFGLALPLAKLAASACSFVLGYAMRKFILF